MSLTQSGLRTVLRYSGTPAAGIGLYTEPFGWDEVDSVKPQCEAQVGAHGEEAFEYAERVWEEAEKGQQGVATGDRELALRSTAIPGQRAMLTWVFQGVQYEWTATEVEGVTLHAVGLANPSPSDSRWPREAQPHGK